MSTVFQKSRISEPAVFGPSDTISPADDFPEICVSTFSEKTIRSFAASNQAEIIAWLPSSGEAHPVYRAVCRDTEVAIYLYRVGAPACVAALEEVIAMGARSFVLFGSCGVLDDAVGERIIVPVSAFRDEGTSYHYCEPSEEIEADGRSLEILEAVLEKSGFPYIKGKTWTTDALYRETPSAVRERKAAGCLAVEMECAAMMAAAQYRRISFAQFLYGADSLASEEWSASGPFRHGGARLESYMQLAVECGRMLQRI